jgi:hypothetical protein
MKMMPIPMVLLAVAITVLIGPTSRAVTFGFTSNSTWNSTLGVTSGYPASPAAADGNTNTILTANQTVDGITMAANAAYATRNLYDLAINPIGFNLATKASYNNITVNGVNNTVATSGNLTNYQRWTFSFSTPVKLQTLFIDDIDNNLLNDMDFWDFLGAEAFVAATPGAVGTGIDPVWSLAPTTGLIQGSIATPEGSIRFVTPSDVTGNPTNDPNYRAGITFGDNYVQSFVLYAFTKRAPGDTSPAPGTDTNPLVVGNDANTHRMAIFNSTVEVIPEPGTASLLLLGLAALAAGRRRR